MQILSFEGDPASYSPHAVYGPVFKVVEMYSVTCLEMIADKQGG
jgi:hypothetical protein